MIYLRLLVQVQHECPEQLYARADDALWQPLLGEGQALRELFRCPVVHGALLHAQTPRKSPGGSGARFQCFSGQSAADDERGGCQTDVECLGESVAVSMFKQASSPGATRRSGKRAEATTAAFLGSMRTDSLLGAQRAHQQRCIVLSSAWRREADGHKLQDAPCRLSWTICLALPVSARGPLAPMSCASSI